VPARAASAAPPAHAAAAANPPAPAAPATDIPSDFKALVELVATGGKPHLAQQLHDYCGLVRYAPPELALKPTKALSGDFARELGAALKGLTRADWAVTIGDGEAEPSLLEQERLAAERERESVLDTPLVKAAFEAFPGAELAGYTHDDQRSA
jgi:DNA polymerase-3 subunit gamma/tau